MSAAVKELPQGKAVPAGCASLSGRITSRRKLTLTDGVYILTVLKLPAADAYSHPGTVEVRSKEPIGAVGDEWTGVVRVSGFPRSYDSKPDADGEIKRIHTAENRLEVVE